MRWFGSSVGLIIVTLLMLASHQQHLSLPHAGLMRDCEFGGASSARIRTAGEFVLAAISATLSRRRHPSCVVASTQGMSQLIDNYADGGLLYEFSDWTRRNPGLLRLVGQICHGPCIETPVSLAPGFDSPDSKRHSPHACHHLFFRSPCARRAGKKRSQGR